MTDQTVEARSGSEQPPEALETEVAPPDLLSNVARTLRISPSTPLGTAMLWRALLVSGPGQRDALDLLTVGPRLSTDYARARRVLPGLSLGEFPVISTAHDDVAYVRFHERNLGQGVLRLRPWFLTLRKGGDGWWRVWSLTADSRPAPEDVLPIAR